jgi:hypothetical protein
MLAALPVAAIALGVLSLYLVEAWSRKTPWVFTDELEWTQISRSIAGTGEAARRGQPLFFKSVYAYVIAPFWWIDRTTTAYAAIKYANAVMMSLAAVPTYLLARMLVTRRAAVLVAVASVAVPAMAYVTSIVPEVLAYPYFALCSWLAVRALRSGRRLDVAIALVFLVCGYFVHQREFTLLPAAFAVAAAGLWITGPRGRAVRRNWTRGDTLGAVVLLVGAGFLVNRVVLQHVHEWQTTTQYYENRMFDLGLDAGLSLAIGLGILPVIGGLVSLRLPDRRGDPTYRAFAAWTGTVIAFLAIYVADKAAYLSTNFATLWEERPLIFLCPLLLLGTAMVFQAKRIDRNVFAGATALVALIVLVKNIQLSWPYYDAPGSAIPAILNYYRHWSEHDVRLGLLGVFAVSVLLIAFRNRRAVAAFTVVLGFAWLLSGEIAATVGIDHLADQFRTNLPTQLSWVDDTVHGQSVTYLGQAIKDGNGESLAEFWNRSVHRVASLDGTAPGPGPTTTPGLASPDGLLSGLTSRYVLADSGVNLAEPVAARPDKGGMVLYGSPNGKWHLLDSFQQVYSDSWCPNWCSYTYFRPGQRGTLVITLGRLGYNGSAPPAHATVSVGTVRLDHNDNPILGRVQQRGRRDVANGTSETIRVPVAQTPVRVEVSIPDTIPPTSADPRDLGAQVGFRFLPAQP